jgi:methylated-DNA-[protein]-cysteine S-methyltransferase
MRARQWQAKMATPFGMVGIRTVDGELARIAFLPRGAEALAASDALAAQVCAEVGRYLADPGYRFRIALPGRGTPFQRRVWNAIALIPPGRTRTYGEIARELGSAPRAVGQACGENPFPLAVPCHRVVSASGLGGFAHKDEGYLLAVKRWLLSHEAPGTERRPGSPWGSGGAAAAAK